MLLSFSARHYRNVTTDELHFKRVNLLIGPNNSGKSNLVGAMSLPRDLLFADERPTTAFLRAVQQRGGAELLDRKLRAPRGEIALRWVLQPADKRPMEYALSFQVGPAAEFPGACFLTRERIAVSPDSTWSPREALIMFDAHGMTPGQGRFPSVKPRPGGASVSHALFPVDSKESVLRQARSLLENTRFREDFYVTFDEHEKTLRSYFEGFRDYSGSELSPSAIAAGAQLDLTARHLDRAGTQLGNVLRYVDQAHDLEDYTLRLREIIPDLRRVKIVDVSETRRDVDLQIGDASFRLREMSDGTLKAMALALLLWTPERMTTLVIDEPELNIHPAWLKVIAGWMLNPASADQIFVSTHSPDLLDGFTEAFREGEIAVFVCGLGDKGIHAVDPRDLDSFFEQGWELGDLYRVGEPQLGGWPW